MKILKNSITTCAMEILILFASTVISIISIQDIVMAASLDDEPLGKGLHVCSITVTYTGTHNFGYGKEADRCYGAKAAWLVCKKDNEFVYRDQDTGNVCWFPSSNKLVIKFKNLGASTYKCSHHDPVLSDRSPSCNFQSYSRGARGATIMDNQVRNYIQKKVVTDFKKTVSPGARKIMKIEAFEHSMEVSVKPKNITSPPGNVRIVLEYASDISPRGQKWPVAFTLKKQNAGSLKPVAMRLADAGTVSHTFKGLSPGNYWAEVAFLDSLTNYVARSLKFTVTAKAGTSHKDWKLIQPKNHDAYLGASIPVKIQLPQDISLKNTNLVLKWSWIKENFCYSVPLKTNFFWEETIPVNTQVAATRIFQKNISTAQLLRLKNRFSQDDKSPCVYFLDVYLKGGDSRWNYHSQAGFLKIDRLVRGGTDPSKFGYNKQNPALRYMQLLKIISPRQGQTYTNSVPVNFQFFSKSKKPNQLTLVWSWSKEPAGKPREFFRQNYTIPAGKTNFSKMFSVSSLYNKKNKKLKNSGFNGSIWLEFILKQGTTTVQKAHANFYVAQLGTPVTRDDSRKKSLTTKMHLPAMSVASIRPTYRATEKISIGLKNTGGKTPQFQVQFRPNANRPFKELEKVSHRFIAKGKDGTLVLQLHNPGEYRVRLKHQNTWGPWRAFQVINIQPAATKHIIPAPSSTIHGSRIARLPVPTIVQPQQDQNFMMIGNSLTIKIRVRHAQNQKVILQVQHQVGKFSPASFRNISPSITSHHGPNESSFDIRLTSTGLYRIRARLASDATARWSVWRNFKVDKLVRKIPASIKIPSQTNIKKTIHPRGLNLKPSGFSIK